MSFYLNGQLYDSSNVSSLYDQSGQLKSGSEFGAGTSALGNFQNALDMITQQSEKASARSLEYAQQNQQWAAEQAQIANNFNAAEAAKNRDWQEYMSNTAHQREIADLKAAGLNPVLSAMGGNGASVTSGASASANLPSGAAGQSDTSANSALVSILGSMLAAQTQLTNQAVSARTQEAVADKYTAMEHLVALIGANASMHNAGVSAAASRYAADRSSTATAFSSLNSLLGTMFQGNVNWESAKLRSETDRWLGNLSSMTQKDIAILESSLKKAGIEAGILESILGLLGSVVPKNSIK